MKKPGVIDEVRMGLDFYPMTLFETLRGCMQNWLNLSRKFTAAR